jgi:hypothetical protein
VVNPPQLVFLLRMTLSRCNTVDIFGVHTCPWPRTVAGRQRRRTMRARDRLKRSMVRWYGVGLLCCAIAVSALVELPLVPY